MYSVCWLVLQCCADGADMSHVKGSAAAKPASPRDVTPQTDHSSSSPGRPPPHTTTLAAASTASSSEAGSDVGVVHITPPAASKDARAAAASEGAVAGPTGLCPVVAFASFAAQLSFKAVLHLMVFAGGLCLVLCSSGLAHSSCPAV